MSRIAIAIVLGVLSAGVAHADVRADEKTQVKFEGMLGRMLNFFGGRAARDGIVSAVSVKGDRKMTLTGDTAQIIDLNEEKVYDLNMKNKTYTVTTFAEMRRQMEEARKKAEAQARENPAPSQPGGQAKPGEPQKEVEVDFSLKESGQKRAINGFDAREVVMTVAVREKGKKLEESGGLVMTSNTWLAPKIAAMNEVADFDRRYAQKFGAPAMLDAQQMAMVTAMYPQMKEAMAKFEAENVNMDGTPVLTVVKFEAVANPEQAKQQEAKSEPEPRSSGGLLGGLGGRLGRRIAGGGDDKPAADAGASNRATIMTMQHEVTKVTPAVNDADLTVPPGFKQR
jgi:hypothetical protein